MLRIKRGNYLRAHVFRFENRQAVWLALNDFRKSKSVSGKVVDFPDALIVTKAKSVADDLKMRLEGFYTFDIAAQQLPGAKAL